MAKTSKTTPAAVDVPDPDDSARAARAERFQAIERRAYALCGLAGVLSTLVEYTMNEEMGGPEKDNIQNGLFDLNDRINEHRDAIIDLASGKGGAE